MAASARQLHLSIPDSLYMAIEEVAHRSDRDPAVVTEELLTEALKMRRIVGIVFADGPTGRRARIAGSGLDLFEIIDGYIAEGKNWTLFRAWFPWLTEEQLHAAVAYYEAYPDEIDARLAAGTEPSPTNVASAS